MQILYVDGLYVIRSPRSYCVIPCRISIIYRLSINDYLAVICLLCHKLINLLVPLLTVDTLHVVWAYLNSNLGAKTYVVGPTRSTSHLLYHILITTLAYFHFTETKSQYFFQKTSCL